MGDVTAAGGRTSISTSISSSFPITITIITITITTTIIIITITIITITIIIIIITDVAEIWLETTGDETVSSLFDQIGRLLVPRPHGRSDALPRRRREPSLEGGGGGSR